MTNLLYWDVYQITCADQSLTGVKLRGTLRKYALEHGRNLLTENASDADNCVRFSVLAGEDANEIVSHLRTIVPTADVSMVLTAVPNPVLPS